MTVRIAVHGWLVLELSDDSEFWVGIYALFLGMGQFLFSMLAGAIADRFQRRTVLLIEGAVSAILVWAFAVVTLLEIAGLWMAIGAAFVMGCLQAVRFTANNRLIYDLVGPRQLVNGVSLWRISAAPMMIFGAVFAGALIEWSGVWAAYAFMGVSLVVALPFVALIGVRGDVDRSDIGLLRQTVEGVQYTARNRPLRTLFTMSVVMESLGFVFLVMIPIMAKNVLGVGGAGMGFLQAGVGIGAVFSMLILAAKGDLGNKPKIIFFNAFCAGIALIGFALSRSLPLSILLAMAVMAFLNAYDLTLGALIQLVAPANLRGRAVSVHSLAISFTALGGFVMGAAGSIVGVPTMLAAGGAGIVVNSVARRPALMRIQEDPHDSAVESRPTNPASVESESGGGLGPKRPRRH